MGDSGPLSSGERQEQRAFSRFKVDGSIALAKPGFLASVGLGVRKEILVNLAEGGALVLSSRKLAVGARLLLRIEIPKWNDVISCEGEVRWCAQSARNERHHFAGLAFRGLSPADARRIGQMRELSTSAEYRAKAGARKDASSAKLLPPKL